MNEKDLKLYKIIISLLLFLPGLFLKNDIVLSFGLLFTSYLVIGYDVILEAISKICHGEFFEEEFLMTIATIGSFAIGEYPEAVAVMLFFQVGEYLEDCAVDTSKRLVTSLARMKSEKARKLEGEKELLLKLEEIKIGDRILVKPGEKIPLDGDVLEGSSILDTKAITGESLPKSVGVSSHVLSGCINLSGMLVMKVTNDESTSTVSKILELMENANRNKTKTESFITKFSRIYTPIVVILALMICLVPVFRQGSLKEWMYRALVFLTISCPCALVISIPLGFLSGLGVLSKYGIILKGTNHIETLENTSTVVLDKTGTLTKGVFEIQKMKPKKIKKELLLEYAAYAECYSNHPIAYAIKKSFQKEIKKEYLSDYKELSGKGVFTFYKNKELLVGNEKLLKEYSIEFEPSKELGSIVYVAYDHKYVGYLVVADQVREDAKEMLFELKKMGITDVVILSGDQKENVEVVAQELNIKEFYSNLLPQEKVEKLEEIKTSRKGSVLFIGDGMNDAPVLAHADLGVSFGHVGSDAAVETCDMILMNDHLKTLATGIKVAKKTKQVVWQNIFFSILIKVSILILGAFGVASIWHAVFADVGVTLLAILYSFTIYLYRYDKGIV